MNSYVTTNIRLPEEDYVRLKQEALKKRKSLSAVIREKIGVKKPEDFAKKLLSIKGGWITSSEVKETRAEVERRMQRYAS